MAESTLPPLIAGPIVRRLTPTQVTLWMATSRALSWRLLIKDAQGESLCEQTLEIGKTLHRIPVGTHCLIELVDLPLTTPLPEATLLSYDLQYQSDTRWLGLNELAPQLLYPNQQCPQVCIKTTLDRVLHGSCRKPHFPQPDGLLTAEQLLAECRDKVKESPAMLLLTGDQIYTDDVAGPLLAAIHQVIDKLGLFDEHWQGATVSDLSALRKHPHGYYQREKLLPTDQASDAVLKTFFRGARKPIFTAAGAHNHLISLSEVIAMYLLCWSDTPWQWLDWPTANAGCPAAFQERYNRELSAIQQFAEGMPRVRRLFAQLPVYMIFDDHDITDDWNLTRAWEEAAYQHPFSRRIIGNALVAYWLCQGWGNAPDDLQPLCQAAEDHLTLDGIKEHDALIDAFLDWDQWHYTLPTTPRVIVIDTRTHRWRSERNPNRPSGLMDWESLSELQQGLIGQPSVILVSPTPVYGVKLIEVVQRVMTFFGKALMVDAENWMAHPGAANVILNIFRHQKTPPQFIILSGDVHYSFAYDITLRSRRQHAQILQITASGIKNAFPATLLAWFDRLNLRLFGPRSLLNWFTKRRHMRIRYRRPQPAALPTLVNRCGIGDLQLSDRIATTQVRYHTVDGQCVDFHRAASPANAQEDHD